MGNWGIDVTNKILLFSGWQQPAILRVRILYFCCPDLMTRTTIRKKIDLHSLALGKTNGQKKMFILEIGLEKKCKLSSSAHNFSWRNALSIRNWLVHWALKVDKYIFISLKYHSFSDITSESKKSGQIAVVIHYCDLSRFFWLRRYFPPYFELSFKTDT